MLSSDTIHGLTCFGKALNLIFPKLSLQNMCGFDHATIRKSKFPPSPQGTPGMMTFLLCPKYDQKFQGGTSRKIGWGCVARFLKPLPYFRPKSVIFPTVFQTWSKIWYPISALEAGAWPECVTSCYGTYTVVGVNIKREMVLSPNDEEVANSSKKHTQFKTRVHKPYPISDQNG